MSNANDDLEELRKELDEIDQKLVKLLAIRFVATKKVGIYKKHNGLPPIDKSREDAQFKRIEGLAEEAGLDPEFAKRFLRLIIDEVVKKHLAIQKS